MLRRSLARTLVRHQSTVTEHYGVPSFSSLESFQTEGIPGLLSQEAFQQGYVQRSAILASNLNKAVAKHSVQSPPLSVLVSSYSKSATKKDIYTNASLLRNISFAMSSLGNARGEQTEIPPKADASSLLDTPSLRMTVDNHPPGNTPFMSVVESSFGSILELKTLLLESAHAINGDGFTWLVAVIKPPLAHGLHSTVEYDSLAVLNTYNAGAPENNDRARQLTAFEEEGKEKRLSQNIYASLEDAQSHVSSVGREYLPLLCIDSSAKVWLHDYGVFGKKQYLEQVWRSIDWETVQQRLPAKGSQNVSIVN